MTFASAFVALLKAIPALEAFIAAAWLDYSNWRAKYDAELAAQALAEAKEKSSTKSLNDLMGKDL